ncbi:hypothetical protein [Dankookia sp. P2]|uniref:hypothetical protein n=1 Tax=Dankookia sp. P2 TaxID=3423955 RepID=UPI003D66E894
MAKGSGKSGQQVAEEHVATLVEVLVRYAGAGIPLPRFHGELNRSALAAECGFDRKIFTTNPRCQELLRKADEEDRKRHLSALDQADFIREQESKIDEERARLEGPCAHSGG